MKPSDAQLLFRVREAVASGEALRIRQQARLKRQEMAALIEVSARTLEKWEYGTRNPTGEAALRYARTLERLRRQSTAPRAS